MTWQKKAYQREMHQDEGHGPTGAGVAVARPAGPAKGAIISNGRHVKEDK